MLSIDTNRRRRSSSLARYGVAVLAAVTATATGVALDPLVGPRFPFATAYLAILLSTGLGGTGPGLVTTLLAGAAAVALGRLDLSLAGVQPVPPMPDVAGLTLFLLTAVAISVLDGALSQARRRAEARRARVEHELAARLQSEEMLAAANRDLERRLAERDELVAREQAARTEAQRRERDAQTASRAKDEFLAVLGHEFRNPLGAISNAINALHETGDRVVTLQNIIDRQSRHLARMLDDLLDVSRIATGKITLHREATDLRQTVERVLAGLEQEDRTRRHQIAVVGPSVKVDGDPVRLDQIVRNLLDNALKYTPADGRIEAEVGEEGGEAVLRVRDTGVGIPPDVLPHIFHAFIQADATLERSRGGLGLGLSVVKHLVELHGGAVVASSAGPGRGSEFVVRLPLAPAQSEPPAPAPPRPKPRMRRILLIEDNPDVRDGLRLLLETWGHSVMESADGRDGIQRAVDDPPDAALVDIGLPGLDGFGVAQALRADPRTRAMFLVAVTGYGQPADVRRAEAAGFDAVLVKPVDPDRLMALLEEMPDR